MHVATSIYFWWLTKTDEYWVNKQVYFSQVYRPLSNPIIALAWVTIGHVQYLHVPWDSDQTWERGKKAKQTAPGEQTAALRNKNYKVLFLHRDIARELSFLLSDSLVSFAFSSRDCRWQTLIVAHMSLCETESVKVSENYAILMRCAWLKKVSCSARIRSHKEALTIEFCQIDDSLAVYR